MTCCGDVVVCRPMSKHGASCVVMVVVCALEAGAGWHMELHSTLLRTEKLTVCWCVVSHHVW